MRRPYKSRRPSISPDRKYHSILVTKLINYIMRSGKKTVAERIVYQAMIKSTVRLKKNEAEALTILETAVANVSPLLEVKSRRIGGATYQVPVEVIPVRRLILALRWLVDAARQKQGKTMAEFLAEELVDANNKTGTALKKKAEMHKAAEANKAFAHFARF